MKDLKASGDNTYEQLNNLLTQKQEERNAAHKEFQQARDLKDKYKKDLDEFVSNHLIIINT